MQQTVDACGYVYSVGSRVREHLLSEYMHIFRVRLLQVCSFYSDGQCEGLYKRNEQRYGSHAFFFLNLTPTRGAWRHGLFMIDNSQWKNLIHRYGIADRRKQDRSLGVDSIIKSLADSLSGVDKQQKITKITV